MKDRKRHEHDSLLYRSVGQRSPNYESLSPVMMTHLRTDGFYGTMFKHHRDCGFQFSGEPTHLLHCILGSVEILGTRIEEPLSVPSSESNEEHRADS